MRIDLLFASGAYSQSTEKRGYSERLSSVSWHQPTHLVLSTDVLTDMLRKLPCLHVASIHSRTYVERLGGRHPLGELPRKRVTTRGRFAVRVNDRVVNFARKQSVMTRYQQVVCWVTRAKTRVLAHGVEKGCTKSRNRTPRCAKVAQPRDRVEKGVEKGSKKDPFSGPKNPLFSPKNPKNAQKFRAAWGFSEISRLNALLSRVSSA